MTSLLIKVYHRYLDCLRLYNLTSFLTFVAIFSVKCHILGAKIQINNIEFPRQKRIKSETKIPFLARKLKYLHLRIPY